MARYVLLLTLLGLVAMHSLPNMMPGANGASATGLATSMSSRPAAPMAMGGQANAAQAEHAGSALHRAAISTQGGLRSADPRAVAPMGCGMDHAGCVAVLRHTAQLAADALAVLVATPPGPPAPASVSTPVRGARAPPDVSLIEMGISRK